MPRHVLGRLPRPPAEPAHERVSDLHLIPIGIVLAVLGHATGGVSRNDGRLAAAGGSIFLPVVLMLLFRQKYPRWWYDWNLEFSRFTNRVTAYTALLDDTYPSTDDHQSVHLDYPEVQGPELNRWLPLVKWLLAVPHGIVLFFLGVAAFFVVIYAWFAIRFTGRYPRGAFGFVEGVMRWGTGCRATRSRWSRTPIRRFGSLPEPAA